MIVSGEPPITVIESGFEAVCWGLLLSVTVTVKLKVPGVVGVPKMEPTVVLSDNPGGKLPLEIDHV